MWRLPFGAAALLFVAPGGSINITSYLGPPEKYFPEYQDPHLDDETDPSSWVRSDGLRLISLGLPRTGTQSFVDAVRILGYKMAHGETFNGGCRVHTNITLERMWKRWTNEGCKTEDFEPLHETLLERGYDAISGDWIINQAWRELIARYPKAKIIVLEHPHAAEGWLRSHDTFRGVRTSPEQAVVKIAAYNRVYTRFIDNVPPSKRLVYNVSQGWEPLAEYLGVPVPTVPYPHLDIYFDGCRGWRELRGLKVKDDREEKMLEGESLLPRKHPPGWRYKLKRVAFPLPPNDDKHHRHALADTPLKALKTLPWHKGDIYGETAMERWESQSQQ